MIELFRVRDGRVSVIHTATTVAPAWTTCGRDARGMTAMPSDPWSAMGWRVSSPGACQRCARVTS